MALNKIIAIGDVHGEYLALMELIQVLDKNHDLKKVQVIFQELTDRGIDSQVTIDYVRSFIKKYPQTVLIQSNHDEMNSRGELYGLNELESAALDYEDGEMSVEHRQFLATLPIFVETEQFIFLHGGLSRGKDHPADDRPEAVIWNSGTDWEYTGKKKLVMGHTVHDEITESGKLIYIDTGATFEYAGKLSAVLLDDQTGKCERKYSIENLSLFDTELRASVQNRRRWVLEKTRK